MSTQERLTKVLADRGTKDCKVAEILGVHQNTLSRRKSSGKCITVDEFDALDAKLHFSEEEKRYIFLG